MTRSLAGFQRRHLRKLAHPLKPVVFVGQAGVTEAVVASARDALAAHELVKVRFHEPVDKKAMAQDLAEQTGAELCGLVGHTVVLYVRDREDPKIELPQRAPRPPM